MFIAQYLFDREIIYFQSGLPSSQIIGGKDAVDGLYPYQASLRDALKNNAYFCSGAIISEHYVITAAQCLTEYVYHFF